MQTTQKRIELLYKKLKEWSDLSNETVALVVFSFLLGHFGLASFLFHLTLAAAVLMIVIPATIVARKIVTLWGEMNPTKSDISNQTGLPKDRHDRARDEMPE